MANRIKKGDLVQVICGDDIPRKEGKVIIKGRKVLEVYPETNKILVQGVNMALKHVRPSKKNPQGGRIQIERPIHASNVMLLTADGNKTTRIKYVVENGKKIRVAKADGSKLD